MTSRLSIEGLLAAPAEARPVWLGPDGERNLNQLVRDVATRLAECRRAGIARSAVVVAPGEARWDTVVWQLALAAAGAVVAPLRRERWTEIHRWQQFLAIDHVIEAGRIQTCGRGCTSAHASSLLDHLRSRGHAGLILATGGTTGVPKVVLHDLASLWGTIRLKPGPPHRVLPLMRFDHIGGLDMVWRALAGGQILVEPPGDLAPAAVAQTVADYGVEIMPATPSFLNLLLLAEADQGGALDTLRTVPYGAEPMPPRLLSRLRSALPRVEFKQRFGTSETGALPVQDAEEGIIFKRDQPGYETRIVDGELWLRTPGRALGYLNQAEGGFAPDGWFRTGDLAEQISESAIRVHGRLKELINVGGEKVLPAEVEAVLCEHPQVADCRVGPAQNTLLGEVVGCEVVWRGPETNAREVKQALHDFAGNQLARHKLPTVVRLVGHIAQTENHKRRRLVAI